VSYVAPPWSVTDDRWWRQRPVGKTPVGGPVIMWKSKCVNDPYVHNELQISTAIINVKIISNNDDNMTNFNMWELLQGRSPNNVSYCQNLLSTTQKLLFTYMLSVTTTRNNYELVYFLLQLSILLLALSQYDNMTIRSWLYDRLHNTYWTLDKNNT